MLLQLLYIVAALVVAGLVLYFVNGAPGLDPTIKWLIRAVVIIFAVVFCLYEMFAMLGGMNFPGPIRR